MNSISQVSIGSGYWSHKGTYFSMKRCTSAQSAPVSLPKPMFDAPEKVVLLQISDRLEQTIGNHFRE